MDDLDRYRAEATRRREVYRARLADAEAFNCAVIVAVRDELDAYPLDRPSSDTHSRAVNVAVRAALKNVGLALLSLPLPGDPR